ncbi:MAG TPA: hypothetical protein VKT78_07900 [Fimbriimonadaceae bacterium]|nr:hypothetical protein [Fimbriimonadaceae bacterium]
MSPLRKFWFKFAPLGRPTPLNLGCGVSASSYEDAVSLLRRHVFKEQAVPEIVSVLEDVDVSSLDARHVLPNMESPLLRGIWFPKGYR